MTYPEFDRSQLRIKPLSMRRNKNAIRRDHVPVTASPRPLSVDGAAAMEDIVRRVRAARRENHPVVLAFGAHTIKNGLAPVLIGLIKEGWVTHLATNGAGIIHDWEFAFQGESSEDVRANVARGEFGLWQETGFYINLAIHVGAFEGRGYGESVGSLIQQDGLDIPDADALRSAARDNLEGAPDRAAAAADLYAVVKEFELPPGFMRVPHPFKEFSVQAAACRLGIPSTGHPMIGHDIIYTHPMNRGASIGRTAMRDFLRFAHSVSRMDGGVYLSVGSAVMSPMIFEKAFSMSQNLAIQVGRPIDTHFMAIVDLAPAAWDWQRDGEPPTDHPAYYLRYCKTFSRMGGQMRYLSADNRDFLLTLYQALAAG